MSRTTLHDTVEPISEEIRRQSRLVLHQLERHEGLIENIKDECEKDNIELFRNIHQANHTLEQLHKTVVNQESTLCYQISQLELKVQKISEKVQTILDILQRKL